MANDLSTIFLVNPNANCGRDREFWEKELSPIVNETMPSYDLVMEEDSQKAYEELDKKLDEEARVIAIGGDGTIHHLVNHLFEKNRSALLGCIPHGTGNDLCRSLHIPADPRQAAALCSQDGRKKIDVGEITATDFSGNKIHRYFVNIASIGLTANVVAEVNSSPEKKEELLCYQRAFFKQLLTHKAKDFEIVINGSDTFEIALKMITLCNGRFFGQGVEASPTSRLDDGKLELRLYKEIASLQSAKENLTRLFIDKKPLTLLSEKPIDALPVTIKAVNRLQPFSLECDGEPLGEFVEATFSLAGRKIEVITPSSPSLRRRSLHSSSAAEE